MNELTARLDTLEARVDELETELENERTARCEAETRVERAEAVAHAAIAHSRQAHERLEGRAAVRWDTTQLEDLTVEPTSDAPLLPVGRMISAKAADSDLQQLRRLVCDPTVDIAPAEVSGLTKAEAKFFETHETILAAQLTDTTARKDEHTTSDIVDRVTHETAQLRRKLHSVADRVGISPAEHAEAAASDDKLNRLLKYGPSDITDRVYAVHERARALLEHAGKWGERQTDSFGARITLTASTVKERLGLKRDESLTSTEVRRVFEKLEDLAADSPRKVSADVGGSGPNRVVIYLTDEEVQRVS